MHKDADQRIRRVIAGRALTVAEIASAVDLNYRTIYRRVASLVAQHRIHVEAWNESRGKGPRAKRYRWGPGLDAAMIPTPRRGTSPISDRHHFGPIGNTARSRWATLRTIK